MPKKNDQPETQEQVQPQGAIIKVYPEHAERNLFRMLGIQINADVKELEQLLHEMGIEEIKDLPSKEAVMLHFQLRHTTGTTLGQIIDPVNGKGIIVDRIIQTYERVSTIMEKKIEKLLKNMEYSKLNKIDVVKEVDEIITLYDIAMRCVRETMNKLTTLVSINAPATLRPPLANVKLGYDLA